MYGQQNVKKKLRYVSFTLYRKRYFKKLKELFVRVLKMSLRMENYSQVTTNFTISQPVASPCSVRAHGETEETRTNDDPNFLQTTPG